MRAVVSVDSHTVNVSITLNLFDRCKRSFRSLLKKSHIENFEFYFRYSFNLNNQKLNPDYLTIAIILSLFPYLGFPRLSVNLPVSKKLRQLTFGHLGIFLSAPSSRTMGGNLESKYSVASETRLIQEANQKPGLAFSMGADSLAARMMMPKDTYSLFIDRPTSERDLYNKENLYSGLKELANNLTEVDTVLSNFENLRKPVGFAVIDSKPDLNLAALAPLVAVASLKGLDSLSLGTVSESLYGFGGLNYSDPRASRYFRSFADFLSDMGLPLFLPLGGLSEINSMRLSTNHSRVTAWSCIRGARGTPCMKCYKCFRKESLKADLLSNSWSSEELDMVMAVPEVSRKLSSPYIHHGNVLAWQVTTYPKPAYEKLADSIFPYLAQLNFIEEWFSPSLEYIPEKYREEFMKKLNKFGISTISKAKWPEAMNWKATGIIESGRTKRSTK
jgi:hypothetical protein